MQKTTVYLPEPLKHALERTAARTGRSEAEVIRQAIAAAVEPLEQPRPRAGPFASGDSGLAESVSEALAGFGER